jgi:hypothetical protein
MEGIFINGEKAKFHPEDILDTNASQYTEEIGTATKEWLSENLTPESAGVVDKTLSIEGAAADAKETGDRINELKSDLSCVNTGIEGRYNAYDTLQLSGNNSAVTSNGDGTYTVGTSDYGASIFGSATLLKAGVYFLFGVPQGYSFLSTTNIHTEAIFTNDSSEPKGIVLESDTTLYLGFRVSKNPNTSFVIRPFLYSTKMEENAKDIEALKSGLNDLGLSVVDGTINITYEEVNA